MFSLFLCLEDVRLPSVGPLPTSPPHLQPLFLCVVRLALSRSLLNSAGLRLDICTALPMVYNTHPYTQEIILKSEVSASTSLEEDVPNSQGLWLRYKFLAFPKLLATTLPFYHDFPNRLSSPVCCLMNTGILTVLLATVLVI